jgi:hypothetical protein
MLKSKAQEVKILVDETVGEHIGYDLGVKMVKDYYDQYGEGGAQFVGKNIIQQIIDQPNCIGINIYKALNEKGQKTYVLVGLDIENQPILEITAVNPNGELKTQEGIVADRNFGLGWFDSTIK